MTAAWTIRRGVPPNQIPAAARLYWRHFGAELQPLSLSMRQGAALVAALMQPQHALVTLAPSGGIIALAGLRDAQGGFLAMHGADFVRALGPVRGRMRRAATVLCRGGAPTSDLILDGVAVRRGWRGRGLARALVAQAQAEARALGHPALRAEVTAGNATALAAWQAMGFHPHGRERLGWLWRPPAHVLRRPCLGDTA